MARWTPGAQGRLQEAAMELFVEQGFDATTVAQIAERAGVTERTFFRHFADKREVLFAGQEDLVAAFVGALRDAPEDASIVELVTAALDAGGGMLSQQRGAVYARRRSGVIASHPGLRERELLKFTDLTTALAEALQQRGIPALRSRLAAELTVSVFTAAFAAWTEGGADADLVELQRDALAEARGLLGD